MKWTKSGGIYWLKEYPFFETYIKTEPHSRKPFIVKYYDEFSTLNEAKTFVLKNLRKLKSVHKYEQIKDIIGINESGWPNNIGDGFYIGPYVKGVRYKWIVGSFQPWRCPCNWYSIRFPMNTSREYLEDWAVKVFNRHIVRFHKEINNSK